ncbi:hypothetical protein BDW62DRAFT_194192 [Aspergillus aurantiobrunneus]
MNSKKHTLPQSSSHPQAQPGPQSGKGKGVKGPDSNRPKKIIQGPRKTLGLPQIVNSGISATIILRDQESPWDTFQPVFSCKLVGKVTSAVQKSRPYRLKAIREYPPECSRNILRLFGTIQHENILSAKECYREGGRLFALVEYCPLTLEHLVSLSPDQAILGAIIYQILNGLHHLITAGFKHTSLTCSNVLLAPNGTIKLALERCVWYRPGHSQVSMINAVAAIMMQLMQSYEMDDGIIGVDNIDRWPLDSEAFVFLEATSSAQSVDALMKHPFVAKKHSLGGLAALARLAPIATKTFYSYPV